MDGPQEYGLNVIGSGVDRFSELDGYASSLAVSADGQTVYVSSNAVAAYDADALDSYDQDHPAPVSWFSGYGSTGNLALAPSGRLYVAQDQETDGVAKVGRKLTAKTGRATTRSSAGHRRSGVCQHG